MEDIEKLANYIDGKWQPSNASEYLNVINPATLELLGEVPLSQQADVDQAAEAAATALPEWRNTPPGDRIQYLFKLKALLDEHIEDISRTITMECGKTIGVAAPMAYFPFSGWKESFFGDLHGQGKHAVEFFTQTKVVVERWPSEWSRAF